ncbi:organic hydroperoxide resistance protein [Pisciglobus halotolerans]|uniref:Peroxiredoxin, Ohr subfamily n=1 Tax=Pisciglobus halotolerans TaxID=745365 RepID=A0A1I3D759_9LACT|nr:organic hydroperoxide resistance protein [Pisciglobus halotolerans]SFH82497.1 peroxiredoxin, Ohr subfamily [Pisciglobus halotolerans]
MSDVKYTTKAINTGGRDGESRLPDGSFSVRVSTPKDMGGAGQGSNPEQLFALGYSACYHSALEHYKQIEKINNESIVYLTVNLLGDPTDNGFKLSAEIEVAIDGLDEDKVQELAEKAHQFCPYSKATRNNIDVTVKAVPYNK